jgi:hypothetical protein
MALSRLQAASATPITPRSEGGVLRLIELDVAAPAGATPTARAQAFLATWADLFDQSDPDLDLLPVMSEAGEQDIVLFEQRFRGIPVFGGRLAVGIHQPVTGGPPRVRFTAGWLLPAGTGLDDVDTIPAMLPATAEDAARAALARPGAPVLGETRLMLFDPSVVEAERTAYPVIAWHVSVGGGEPRALLIDAHGGDVLFHYGLAPTSGGLSDYDADFQDANGGTMVSTNCFNPTTIDDTAGDEDGLNSTYINDPEIGALWWHTRETYLDYHDKLGRHSWDDDDEEIVVYAHIGLDSNGNPNASFNPGCDEFEFHDNFVGKDVVAHEFTHGVISASISNLVYQGQSGALNEAFADSMAALVVDDNDWVVGDNLLNGGGPIRSLADPLNGTCAGVPTGSSGPCGDPDRFSQFVVTSNDSGGVHTNSGIQNKATFLMSQGGTFNGQTVVGMGRTKTSRLIYFMTRFLLPSTSSFVNARNFAVAAAKTFVQLNLYGFNAANVCTVRNAYAAVELGAADADCNGIEDNVDDSDGDGVFADTDNCPNVSNPSQSDFDQDGTGDACDSDDDNDGISDGADLCPGLVTSWYGNGDPDNDGLGRACDPDDDNDGVPDDGAPGDTPCASGQTVNCDDNCIEDFNPDQFDGNANGEGDACDPDPDGDGYYVESDNCIFVFNPSQADADNDGIGDACDKCPNTSDNSQAYTSGFPELGVDPQPYQPDSDGDGIPDACDGSAFGNVGVAIGGVLYNPSKPNRADGARKMVEVSGDPGGLVRIPLDICDPDADPDGYRAGEYVQVSFEGLEAVIEARVTDDGGGVAGRSRRARVVTGGADRGLRFKPRCDRHWVLELLLGSEFGGNDAFTLIVDVVPGGGGVANPWSSIDLELMTERPIPEPSPSLSGVAAVAALAACMARRRARKRGNETS